MAKKLDLNIFNSGVKVVKIGQLTKDIIDFLDLQCIPCDIVLWHDRLEYIEKHKSDFESEVDFYKHIELIPDIIENFDYIGKHPSDNSIQFIKHIDKYMLVGIRLKASGNLSLRSSYPITEEYLKKYIQSGTVWSYNEVKKNSNTK